MNSEQAERLEAKTPERCFLRVLEDEFDYAPKIAEAILEEAQASLVGTTDAMRPGQVRVILTRQDASHGRALRETATTEAVWTVDAGLEDRRVLQRHGRKALRQARIQRLVDQALAQGAVATQEDLAQVLHVSLRTIKRDCAALQRRGIYLPTRGKLQGIGRGQTHKAIIVGHWLRSATYDQIARETRHSLSSIKRYIQTFVRVIKLHEQGFPESQIGMLLGISPVLVREYLAVHDQHPSPECRERLAEQMERLGHAGRRKRGAK
jgi:hypothetical protein